MANQESETTLSGTARGAWQSGLEYAAGDLVVSEASAYRCLTAHRAGEMFFSDLASGHWQKLAAQELGQMEQDAAKILARTRIEIQRNHEDLQGIRDSNGWLRVQLSALAKRALTVVQRFGQKAEQIAKQVQKLGREMADILDASDLNVAQKNMGDFKNYYGGVLQVATDQLMRRGHTAQSISAPQLKP